MSVEKCEKVMGMWIPKELAKKINIESKRKHTTKTAIIVDALDYYFRKPELAISRAAFLASTELLALARKQGVDTVRERLLAEAIEGLEDDRGDLHQVIEER